MMRSLIIMSNGGASSSCSAVLALAFAIALGCITGAGKTWPAPHKKRHTDIPIRMFELQVLHETDDRVEEMSVKEMQDEVEKVKSLDGSIRSRSAPGCELLGFESHFHPSHNPHSMQSSRSH